MAFDQAIGTMTVYCEASGAGAEAQLAVAYSLMNRLAAGRYGATVAEVCLRRYQYSEWLPDAGDNADLLRAARVPDGDLVLQACAQALAQALSGAAPDPTGGATHYYGTNIAAPAWTRGATETCQIANLIFYKDVQ